MQTILCRKVYEKECSTTISSSDRKNCWITFVSLWYGIHCIQINGWKGLSHGGFLPTGETASFILAGADTEKRKGVIRCALRMIQSKKKLWIK
nr:hypothetical protein [Bacteroides timonensis]